MRRLDCLSMCICAAMLIGIVQAQAPSTKRVRLKKKSTPPNVQVGRASVTPGLTFEKDNGERFEIIWGSRGNPCEADATINHTNPVCLFKRNVCEHGDTATADHKCHFGYKTADGDPEVVIDEGNNGPPPDALKKQAAAYTQKMLKSRKAK